ncbi:MAG: pseudouridine-5'-phosphate glycosidase [Bacilli bacterium]|nr:pseudouridine-5'-phosphate glycosidase [Bacilli bacterium]
MNIRINQEVKEALEKGLPVVSLESTIISHGMPYPKNVETALKVEEEVRKNGAIPATIGIIDGVCVVGLTKDEIEQFATRKDVVKVSRRDLPVVMAKKLWGATTVATTMIVSKMAGIKVFVTGGIGGVHRGANETFDISADLQELANTDVLVVCAGAKAILDLPLTLEYLETFGVPVLGYKTDELPAFYSRHSGLNVDYNMDTTKECALVMYNKWNNGLKGGILLTNPIEEQYSLDFDKMDAIIKDACIKATKEGIKGKKLTPFLLSYIKDVTKGESLESNIELVLNNARVGAQIAKDYSELIHE